METRDQEEITRLQELLSSSISEEIPHLEEEEVGEEEKEREDLEDVI